MDDVDSLFPRRDSTQNESHKRLIATLLTLMDGMAKVHTVQINMLFVLCSFRKERCLHVLHVYALRQNLSVNTK